MADMKVIEKPWLDGKYLVFARRNRKELMRVFDMQAQFEENRVEFIKEALEKTRIIDLEASLG